MNRRAGFTFIELFTTLSIIMILAAILFPVFAKAREKARQTTCLSSVINIGIALKAYANDYNGHFPPANNDLWPLAPRYLPEAGVFLCPSRMNQPALGYPPPNPDDAPEVGRVIDYVYRGGFCDDDRPDLVIVGEDRADMHNGGANYLFTDGHAKWFTRAYVEGARPDLSGVPGPPPDPSEYAARDSESARQGFPEIVALQQAKSGRPSDLTPEPERPEGEE